MHANRHADFLIRLCFCQRLVIGVHASRQYSHSTVHHGICLFGIKYSGIHRSKQWWEEDDDAEEPAAKRSARATRAEAAADPDAKPWWDDGTNDDDDGSVPAPTTGTLLCLILHSFERA